MSEKFRIRKATKKDVELIGNLRKQSMETYIIGQYGKWDEEVERRALLAAAPEDHEIIEVDGEPIGCMLVKVQSDSIKLSRIYILPTHQNRGIGSHILKDICLRADQLEVPVYLRVLKVNPAKHLYERFGFGTYETTETHFLMRRPSN